ncbi:MAG: SIMPL domain-containing protein, partial [Bacteroidales bacterium]|nr:SIMPL domain-containing protein [Bacteroidales bacterium]
MEKKNVIIASVFIMFGLIIGFVGHGFLLKLGIGNFVNKDRCVSVKGLSEREVPADHVTWPIVYKEVGNDISELFKVVDAKNQLIMDFLKKNGVSDDEITISPLVIIDREADRWSTTEIPYRYQLKSVVTVTSKQVDKVR